MDGSTFSAYYAEQFRLHDPPNSCEQVARAEVLLTALQEEPAAILQLATDFGFGPIRAIHTPELIQFLQTAYTRFGQLKEGPRPAIPDSFAVRELAGRVPHSIWGQLGYYCSDSATPILEHTWAAAYWSAQVALSTAAKVIEGAPFAYALCRPPGHHAYADMFGGYCYLNNAAIAAEWLVKQDQRVAILDIDYHHGNGTQAIFYNRADVLVASVHAHPDFEYPYFCGHSDERGHGMGFGFNLNLPLPAGTDEPAYLVALDTALAAVDSFKPDVVVVSLGFDALAGDPEGSFLVTTESFERIGQRIEMLGRPLVVIQEGGYLLGSLANAQLAFWRGILHN